MNKYLLGFLLLAAVSYSQDKIEKGTYVSNSLGQQLKLHLKENNQYELVVFSGDFEIKDDILHLNNNTPSSTSDFSVAFSSEANPGLGKVKVKLTGDYLSLYASALHIGMQSGTSEPKYYSFSDYLDEQNYEASEVTMEVNRSDYFYLAKEDYAGETTLVKYALPREANEIQVQYTPNYMGEIKLQGYWNEKNELVISEGGKKSPLTFVLESQKAEVKKAQVQPIETKKQKDWTFAGKKDKYDYGIADSSEASDYKLVVQDNLQKALEATKKTPSKFLVISYDPDNKNAKKQFDEFIKDQEYSVGSYISYGENEDYDIYNYYLATGKDKAWASKNNIQDNPSIVILGADGTILSQTKGAITKNQTLFGVYYNPIKEDLKKTQALINLNKTLNSKAKESEILKGFVALSSFTNDNGEEFIEASAEEAAYFEPPVVDAVDSTAVAYENDDYYANQSFYTKPNFDKKKVLSAWDNIVKSHSKDTKPDMDFVKVALDEVRNIGFYKKLFGEERLFDETNFKAMEYLIKHYDAIAEIQNNEREAIDIYNYRSIESDLNSALSTTMSLANDKNVGLDYQKKMLELYKKISDKGSDAIQAKMSYFNFLDGLSQNMDVEKEYAEGYDAFYNRLFEGKGSAIEVLDELYSTRPSSDYSYGYQDWVGYKSSFAHLSNQAAWFVVEKSKNPESVKKAIRWSESSLQLDKNNPYYLDTLAQLYYKNGEKGKAISTQEQALKFAQVMDETLALEVEEVLKKMKNGTY